MQHEITDVVKLSKIQFKYFYLKYKVIQSNFKTFLYLIFNFSLVKNFVALGADKQGHLGVYRLGSEGISDSWVVYGTHQLLDSTLLPILFTPHMGNKVKRLIKDILNLYMFSFGEKKT